MRKDLTGQKFGRLTVIEYAETRKTNSYWLCKCDCGNQLVVSGSNLRFKNSKACRKCPDRGHKKPYGEAAFNRLLSAYRANARHRGLEFSISVEDFRKLTSSDCFYCGKPPAAVMLRENTNGSYIYNGIDRLDSSLDYVLENVVPCCAECNRAKMGTPYVQFRDWIFRVSDYMRLKSQTS